MDISIKEKQRRMEMLNDVEIYNELVRLTELRGRVVIHKNHNGLDNQDENLAVVDIGSPEAKIEAAVGAVASRPIVLPTGETAHIYLHDHIAYIAGMLDG